MISGVSTVFSRHPLAFATGRGWPSGPGASISAPTNSICLPERSIRERTHRSPSAGTPPSRSTITRLNRVSSRCSQRSSARTSSAETGAPCWIAADHVLRTRSVAASFSPRESLLSISS